MHRQNSEWLEGRARNLPKVEGSWPSDMHGQWLQYPSDGMHVGRTWQAHGGDTEYEADLHGIVLKSQSRCIYAVSQCTFIKHQIDRSVWVFRIECNSVVHLATANSRLSDAVFTGLSQWPQQLQASQFWRIGGEQVKGN